MIYISDALVLSGESDGFPLRNSRIGYDSITFGKTPTASSTQAGFSALAPTYPTTYEFWKPSTLPATWAVPNTSLSPCNYAGIVGDIKGASIIIQTSEDGVTWVDVTQNVATSNVAMFLFEETLSPHWRVRFSGKTPSVSVIYIGKALAMQRSIYVGHTPITLSRKTTFNDNVSENGQFLGRSITREGVETGVAYQHLTSDWYRENFDPFVKSARTLPFFFAWKPDTHPAEVGYVWTSTDIRPQNTGPVDFMSVSFSMTGVGVD